MKKSIINTIDTKEFEKIVKEHNSISSILDYFGFSSSSGSMSKIVKERILRENINISHFNKTGHKGGVPIYSLEEILIENSPYGSRERLKKRILKAGLIEYKCEKCGNNGIWNGKKLVLQLEHKNGKHNDNRISNLCFLCPNCHSQTDTYAGKNINKSNWKNFSSA